MGGKELVNGNELYSNGLPIYMQHSTSTHILTGRHARGSDKFAILNPAGSLDPVHLGALSNDQLKQLLVSAGNQRQYMR